MILANKKTAPLKGRISSVVPPCLNRC